jgi:hypothetical protein
MPCEFWQREWGNFFFKIEGNTKDGNREDAVIQRQGHYKKPCLSIDGYKLIYL